MNALERIAPPPGNREIDIVFLLTFSQFREKKLRKNLVCHFFTSASLLIKIFTIYFDLLPPLKRLSLYLFDSLLKR